MGRQTKDRILMTTNKEVATAFKMAKRHLARTDKEVIFSLNKRRYICHALNLTLSPGRYAAMRIVQARLWGMGQLVSLEDWLHWNKVPYAAQPVDRLQLHRHTWLNMLIKEFENKKGKLVIR